MGWGYVSAMKAKDIVKQALFGGAYLCESAKLALPSPQREVSVFLEGLPSGLDVTMSNVICGLSPLLIGIGLPDRVCLAAGPPVSLVLSDVATGCVLASIRAQVESALPVGGDRLYLLRPLRSRRYHPSLPQQWAGSAWLRIRGTQAQPSSHAAEVNRRDRDAVFAFYMCPRRLVLISAFDGKDLNIFPMDLMGPVAPGWATFALKTDKPIVELLRCSGRFVASSVPEEATELAFDCGKNHRIRGVDPAALTFSLTTVGQLHVPVPRFALDAVEYVVEDAHRLGSHTLFVARETGHAKLADGAQVHLTMATFLLRRERHRLEPRREEAEYTSQASVI
jgi:flavin reductase (DIM6/NTAB) family NADH-FMN oxidoreductase RutF